MHNYFARLTNLYPELKSQNFFVADGGSPDTVDPRVSKAVCQLDEVDSIQRSADGKTYTMSLEDSEGGKCTVEIKKESITAGPDTTITAGSNTYCGSVDNQYTIFNVTYNGSALKIYASMENDDTELAKPLECKLTADDDSEPIDTKYIRKQTFGLLMTGKAANTEQSTSLYEVFDKNFRCQFTGNMFGKVEIKHGNNHEFTEGGEYKFTVEELGSTEKDISCDFKFPMNDNDNVLEGDLIFTLTKKNVKLYGCTPGYVLDLERGFCVGCPAGKYKSNSQDTECSPCAENEYAPTVASKKCIPCEGKVNNSHTECEKCLPGKVYSTDGECKACPGGQYWRADNACHNCDLGNYSLEGWTECKECPPGSQVKDGNDGCEPCPPGRYRNSSMDRCEQCPDETYSDMYGASECTSCSGKINADHSACEDKYCPRVADEDYGPLGTLNFSETIAGYEAEATCAHGGTAKRECNSEGDWMDPDTSKCNSINTKKLEEFANDENGNVTDLVDITLPTNIGTKDVSYVVETVLTEQEIDKLFQETQDDGDVTELTDQTIKVMSNLIEVSTRDNHDQELKNAVVEKTEQVVMAALKSMPSRTSGDKDLDFETASMKVKVKRGTASSLKFDGGWLVTNEKSNIDQVAAIVYEDQENNLFDIGSLKVVGKVVGLNSIKKAEADGIDFELKFAPESAPEDSNPSKIVRRDCMFYDTVSRNWSAANCTTSFDSEGNVVCQCNHMTSFAVILSVDPNHTVTWLSDVVLAVNIFFCLLTLLSTLPFRTFRVRKMTIIQSHSILCLIMLCLCWYLMHIDFGQSARESVGCKVVAFIAHYFLMATFSWIFCCTITLKSQIVDAVKSFGKKNKNLVKKCTIFAYGFPLLIPCISILLDLLLSKTYGETGIHYLREAECWYTELYMYTFILFPIYVFLLINFISFFRIMRVIGGARRGGDEFNERRIVKAGLGLVFMQGLPWIIHPSVTTGTAAVVLQYLFLVVFGMQGLGLFLFNVLFQEEVLKNLCGILHVKPPQQITSRNSNWENKGFSNNINTPSHSGTADHVGNSMDKSLYQDSFYNALHESSLVTEYKTNYVLKEHTARETSKTELFANTTPIPGETESDEQHKGPPFL